MVFKFFNVVVYAYFSGSRLWSHKRVSKSCEGCSKAASRHMKGLPKAAANSIFKNLGEKSITAAFGKPCMWPQASFGNPFMKALAAC
jgi:hypothetical protein